MPDTLEHKAMWNKLDRHDTEIQQVRQVAAVLEHRANETDNKILRMLDSSEINQAKTHEMLTVMGANISTVAANNNKMQGARDATKFIWPIVLTLAGLGIAYTQYIQQ